MFGYLENAKTGTNFHTRVQQHYDQGEFRFSSAVLV